MKRLILIAMSVLMSTSIAFAQDFCQGDFEYDGDVDADDVTTFLEHFGREPSWKPCPPDGPAPIAKTGQLTSYYTGDDANYQTGVGIPQPRFTDHGNGTVTDNLTGLMWLVDANCISTGHPGFDNDGTAFDGAVTWIHALDFINGVNDGSYYNCQAGHTDWRLPNRRELFSLVHDAYYNPVLSNAEGTEQWTEGDPFVNVMNTYYWSSTTNTSNTIDAWHISMYSGGVVSSYKTNYYYVWPVRGGH